MSISQKISIGIGATAFGIEYAFFSDRSLKAFVTILLRDLILGGIFSKVAKFIPTQYVVKNLQKLKVIGEGAVRTIISNFSDDATREVFRIAGREFSEYTAQEGFEYILRNAAIPGAGRAGRKAYQFFANELFPVLRNGTTGQADELLKEFIRVQSRNEGGPGIVAATGVVLRRAGYFAAKFGNQDIARFAFNAIKDIKNVYSRL